MLTPIRAILLIAPATLLAQVAPAVGQTNIDGIGRLTLDGALIMAVGWLGRELKAGWARADLLLAAKDIRIAEKDAQVVGMAMKVTETMTEVLAAVKELRKSNDEIGSALDNVASQMALLEGLQERHPR